MRKRTIKNPKKMGTISPMTAELSAVKAFSETRGSKMTAKTLHEIAACKTTAVHKTAKASYKKTATKASEMVKKAFKKPRAFKK